MSLSPAEAAFVRELVHRRSAIVLDESKQYLIETRLEPLASQSGFPSIAALVGAARAGRTGLQTRVVEALATHETSFFRDLSPFECLRRDVLPRLYEARAARRALNIWCAACSTGQEPYSVAMMLEEHFGARRDWAVRIYATDLSEQALQRARAGTYHQIDLNRGLPAALLLKHFDRTGASWSVKESLRSRVEFAQLNLIEPWTLPFIPDVVMLRNVLIYFDQATKRAILARVRETMARDGVLFLGGAETTLNVDERWARVPFEKTAYYRPQV
jgi:chemotaxis protein methyltransferase CheR